MIFYLLELTEILKTLGVALSFAISENLYMYSLKCK